MKVVIAPKVDEYCCDSMRGLMQSGDVVLHHSTLAFRYAGIPVGEERFFDLIHCPKCGQKIVLNGGRQTVSSVAPAMPAAEKARIRSRDNHVMVVAGLLGVGLFMFVQFAFGMLSDVMGWNVAEAAEQCKILYMTGNVPMYSCGPAP